MIINYINVNQTNDLIGIGTNEGFIIKNFNNKILIKRNIGKVNIIEIYKKSNIFFIVGNNNNILQIYNDNTQDNILNIKVDMRIEIVKIQELNILVATKKKIYLYDLNTLELKKTFLINNLKIDIKHNYLVYVKDNKIIELYNTDNYTTRIKQNNMNNIQIIKISSLLKYLVIISENGCIIKIYDLYTHKLLREDYRGLRECKIKYVSFTVRENLSYVFYFTL